jgi:hypothetical protein
MRMKKEGSLTKPWVNGTLAWVPTEHNNKKSDYRYCVKNNFELTDAPPRKRGRPRGTRDDRKTDETILARIRELADRGMSGRKIAKEVEKSEATVRRILKQNPPQPSCASDSIFACDK